MTDSALRYTAAALIIILLSGALLVAFAPADAVDIGPDAKKSKRSIKISNADGCKGAASCFTGQVKKIVDGDTIDVSVNSETIRIRLALTNTPEKGQQLYKEAKQFTAKLCSVGSTALVDQDDGQKKGSYERMVAKVSCGAKALNAELLYAGLAVIMTEFCSVSEFATESWARDYGC